MSLYCLELSPIGFQDKALATPYHATELATDKTPDFTWSERWFTHFSWQSSGYIDGVRTAYGRMNKEPLRARAGIKHMNVNLRRIMTVLENLDEHWQWAPNCKKSKSFAPQDLHGSGPEHEAVKRQVVVIETGPFRQQGVFSLHCVRREGSSIFINTYGDKARSPEDHDLTQKCGAGELVSSLRLTPDPNNPQKTFTELKIFVRPQGVPLPNSAINRLLRDIAARYLNSLEAQAQQLQNTDIQDPKLSQMTQEAYTASKREPPVLPS